MSKSPEYPSTPMLKPIMDALLPTMPVRTALAPPMRLVIFGGLPPIVRERFGIGWSGTDEAGYLALRTAIKQGWRAIPAALKWHDAARKGWLRELGRVPRRV
jgi:uncharacterized protein (DUF2236 family)